MERLTERRGNGVAVYKHPTPEPDGWEVNRYAVLEKCCYYEDMEEQGKLFILPCKPGDTIYTNLRVQGWYMRSNKAPYKVTVAFIGINGKNNFFNVVYENDNVFQFSFSDIGKTVFLTEQEAKEALERMKE